MVFFNFGGRKSDSKLADVFGVELNQLCYTLVHFVRIVKCKTIRNVDFITSRFDSALSIRGIKIDNNRLVEESRPNFHEPMLRARR